MGTHEQIELACDPSKSPSLQAILNAVGNASRVPITPADIAAILQGEGGLPAHVRVIFSDVSLRGLEQAGASCGVGLPTILDAYMAARATAAAANAELDRALSERW